MKSSLCLYSKIGRNIIKIESSTNLSITDCVPSLSFPTCNRKVIVKGMGLRMEEMMNLRMEEMMNLPRYDQLMNADYF